MASITVDVDRYTSVADILQCIADHLKIAVHELTLCVRKVKVMHLFSSLAENYLCIEI